MAALPGSAVAAQPSAGARGYKAAPYQGMAHVSQQAPTTLILNSEDSQDPSLEGSSQLDGCSSGAGAGGGLHVSESLDLAGDLMASGCHSGDDGGGLHVALGLSQTAGSLRRLGLGLLG